MSDEVILSELQDLNFSEDQAQMVFAILENRPVRRRRTWKENKMFKAEARKDRKFFRKGDAHHEGGHQRPGGRGNRAGISRENLKKISFCRNCGKKGHWAEDCQQPKATSGRLWAGLWLLLPRPRPGARQRVQRGDGLRVAQGHGRGEGDDHPVRPWGAQLLDSSVAGRDPRHRGDSRPDWGACAAGFEPDAREGRAPVRRDTYTPGRRPHRDWRSRSSEEGSALFRYRQAGCRKW